MHTLLQDLRYGFRMLLKQKGLTSVALLSLALGIGANTALFSIVDAMLLKMLPVKEPERLVLFKSVASKEFSVGSYNGSSNSDEQTGLVYRTSFPYLTYQRLREQPGPMSDIFAFGNIPAVTLWKNRRLEEVFELHDRLLSRIYALRADTLLRTFGKNTDADHRIARNHAHQFRFAHVFGVTGAHRQHHVTHVRSAVDDANLDIIGQPRAEFCENRTRLNHHA